MRAGWRGPRDAGSEIAVQELGPAHAERPVRAGVGRHRDDEVARREAGGLTEPPAQSRVEGALLRVGASLLEDLQHDQVVTALDAQPGVLADRLPGTVLGDHLVAAPGRSGGDRQ